MEGITSNMVGGNNRARRATPYFLLALADHPFVAFEVVSSTHPSR